MPTTLNDVGIIYNFSYGISANTLPEDTTNFPNFFSFNNGVQYRVTSKGWSPKVSKPSKNKIAFKDFYEPVTEVLQVRIDGYDFTNNTQSTPDLQKFTTNLNQLIYNVQGADTAARYDDSVKPLMYAARANNTFFENSYPADIVVAPIRSAMIKLPDNYLNAFYMYGFIVVDIEIERDGLWASLFTYSKFKITDDWRTAFTLSTFTTKVPVLNATKLEYSSGYSLQDYVGRYPAPTSIEIGPFVGNVYPTNGFIIQTARQVFSLTGTSNLDMQGPTIVDFNKSTLLADYTANVVEVTDTTAYEGEFLRGTSQSTEVYNIYSNPSDSFYSIAAGYPTLTSGFYNVDYTAAMSTSTAIYAVLRTATSGAYNVVQPIYRTKDRTESIGTSTVVLYSDYPQAIYLGTVSTPRKPLALDFNITPSASGVVFEIDYALVIPSTLHHNVVYVDIPDNIEPIKITDANELTALFSLQVENNCYNDPLWFPISAGLPEYPNLERSTYAKSGTSVVFVRDLQIFSQVMRSVANTISVNYRGNPDWYTVIKNQPSQPQSYRQDLDPEVVSTKIELQTYALLTGGFNRNAWRYTSVSGLESLGCFSLLTSTSPHIDFVETIEE